MTSIQNGSGNYSVHAEADRGAQAVAAGTDAVDAPRAAQVQERAHQRVGRHRHFGRLERRRRPRRRRRQHNRLSMIVQGPDIEQLQGYAAAAAREGEGNRRRRRRRHQLRGRRSPSCASRSTASARPTSACRWTRCRRRPAHARRRRGSVEVQGRRRTVQRPAAARRAVPNNPATHGRHASFPAAGGRMVRVSDVAHLTMGNAPGVDRPLQPHAPDLGQRQPRHAEITLGDAIAAARQKVERSSA